MSHDVVSAVGEALEPWLASGTDTPPTLVVALSGGLDSCVLLHALRFGLGLRSVRAAHFDHGIRPDSAGDAAWVRGLCRAWEVELTTARWAAEARDPEERPSEGAARTARYAFLHQTRSRWDPALLLTAHHADDQAETVLFRTLRGTGIDGLAGIPRAREPGIVRPLLDLWREELEAYARRHRVSWREDPTNRDVGYARNVVRQRILPLAEEVAPGARRALVRLSGIAGEEREAWRRALDSVVDALEARTDEGVVEGPAISVDRDTFLALGPELGSRVLRHVVRERLDRPPPDRAATRRALSFAASGRSGGRVELGAGVELARDLDRIRIGVGDPEGDPREDTEVCITGLAPGEADACIGGRRYRVRWAPAPGGGPTATGGSRRISRWPGAASGDIVLQAAAVRFPLRIRGRRPGDRMGVSPGGRKLKKVLLEARVPAATRGSVPVLVDAEGQVVWIPGVALLTGVVESSGARDAHGTTDVHGGGLRITVEPDAGEDR